MSKNVTMAAEGPNAAACRDCGLTADPARDETVVGHPGSPSRPVFKVLGWLADTWCDELMLAINGSPVVRRVRKSRDPSPPGSRGPVNSLIPGFEVGGSEAAGPVGEPIVLKGSGV